MKKRSFLFICLWCTMLIACSEGTTVLFDGKNSDKWQTTGNVSVKEGIFTFGGTNAQAVLKSGDYKDFVLSMEVYTTVGSKGAVWFHTDADLQKGYAVAINNDKEAPIWWKMSGSLLSVRNITKNFVADNNWFTLNIRVEGQSISTEINSKPVVEYIEPAKPYRTEANSGALLSSGTFAIVSNGDGEIQFRNITVTPLNLKETGTDIAAQLAEAVDEQTDEIIRLHQENFPVQDYHVHLKGGLTKEVAAKQSRKTGINYAVAPNCGIGFPVTSDNDIYAYLDTMRSQPFITAMQAEGREWLTTFSKDARDEFDYVFTDALTFTDSKDRRTRLWIPEETWIENEQKYMDLIVDKICDVLKEPVDIYVNPCFLPKPMNEHYDEFWTESRINKFVDALSKSGKALEINELYQIPNKAIILKAKEAGVKFTFGTNNVVPEVSLLEYSIKMKKECGLQAIDMYKPKLK